MHGGTPAGDTRATPGPAAAGEWLLPSSTSLAIIRMMTAASVESAHRDAAARRDRQRRDTQRELDMTRKELDTRTLVTDEPRCRIALWASSILVQPVS